MDANGCFAADCGGLKGQDISAANKCDIKKTVQEDYDSCEFCYFRPRCVFKGGANEYRVDAVAWCSDAGYSVCCLKSGFG